jgi:hypothetical protein
MLYESGTTSYKELFTFYTILEWEIQEQTITDSDHYEPPGVFECRQERICELLSWVKQKISFIREMATNPRSLMSTCRLAVSHCLDPLRRIHRDVQTLDTLSPKMKDYVMFTDLTEPSYGVKQEPQNFDHVPSLLDTIQKMKEEDEAKEKEALKRTAVHEQEEQLAQRPR